MPEIAMNPQTGQVFILSPAGQWEPVKLERDPNTGQEFFFDGQRRINVADLRPLEENRLDPDATSVRQPQDTKLDRFLTGLGDHWYGGLQLLAHTLPRGVASAVPGLTPEQTRERVAQREAAFRDARLRQGLSPNGFDPYRLAGQITSTLPLMAVPGAQTLLGAALQGAAIGAALSATTPIDAEGDEYHRRLMDNLRFGAMAGGFGGVASNLVGRALAPRIDPKVQRLHEAGVELTPGQVIGGTARKIEDQLASYPLGIDAARRRGIESFNRAVANEVLEPIGKRVPRNAPVGRELVESVQQAISSAYDDALSRIPPLRRDAAFEQVINKMQSAQFRTDAAKQEFQNALSQEVLPYLQGETINARALQTAASELRRLASEYRPDPSPSMRKLADAFDAARKSLLDLVAQRAPEAAPKLEAANAAYARFVRMQSAAGMQGATDGVFSPAHFSYAVRQADPSLRHGAYARGDALMQDLSDAARAVLPQTVPDSGTAGRAAIGLLVSGGASGILHSPTPLAAFLASQALYSRPINQAIVNTMLATRPPAIVATGEAVRRMGAPVAVPLGNMLLEPPPYEPMR